MTAASRDQRQVLPVPTSVTTTNNGTVSIRQKINGHSYLVTRSPQCHVCQQTEELTRHIAYLANAGVKPKQIWNMIDAKGLGISIESLRNHLRRHVARYEAYDYAAASMARAFNEIGDTERMMPRHSIQMVIDKGTMLLAGDQIEIKASDLLTATRLMYEMDRVEAESGDSHFYGEAMSIVIGEVNKMLSPEQFNRLMYALDSNERMQEIAALINGHRVEIELQDAERGAERDVIEATYSDSTRLEPEPPVDSVPSYAELLKDL